MLKMLAQISGNEKEVKLLQLILNKIRKYKETKNRKKDNKRLKNLEEELENL
ncbi:hypothetical protein HZA38_04280 [Candidatus Peregrinibacteria bacterium]|nr:hypothetical protein [Candidatus Peregrinibacteria bacterium]